MENSELLSLLPAAILPWYGENCRDLPWRADREPYHIWLSEIMLQQTRVEAVKGYYQRFLAELPTIADLAHCDDDRLFKLWEGLGYYSRARNLKAAANVVMEKHGGVFPRNSVQVLALPGIGAYTAGAICSIAYDQPTAAVDGNVLRVYARLLDDHRCLEQPREKKEVQQALEAVYPERAGDFTQALMELGATLCGPNRPPECEKCPCRSFCRGYAAGTAPALPVRAPKKQKRQEDMTVFILSCDGRYALEKRPGRGLLAGLWQFPNTSGKLTTQESLRWLEGKGLRPREIYRETEKKHIFTHIQWNMKGIYLQVQQCAGEYIWFTAQEIAARAALPTAFRQFWEEETDV